MGIKRKVLNGFIKTLAYDKSSINYILYYTLLEGILVLAIPLTSSFVINSLVAHSYISLITLGIVISVIFILIVALRLIQEYIIEKFEQKVFVRQGLDTASKVYNLKENNKTINYPIDKLMNYFFEITTIQKIFPVFILNGAGLIIQVLLTLLLLLIFNENLFFGAFGIIFFYIILIIFLGKNGIKFAAERSDTKHSAIHYLQKLPNSELSKDKIFSDMEKNMSKYVDARQNQFGVRIKQLAISFLTQGIIITGFFILGGYLVINGSMPIGEFVASEIIVVTLIYAMNSFVKQIDYIYDGIEGYYKIGKLSSYLEGSLGE